MKKKEKVAAKQQNEMKTKRELEAKVKKEVAAQREEHLRLQAVEADVPELIAISDESGMSSEGEAVGSPASFVVRSDSSASEVLSFAEVSSQVFVKDKVNNVSLADQPGVSGTASVARAKRNGAQMEDVVAVESKKAKSPKKVHKYIILMCYEWDDMQF